MSCPTVPTFRGSTAHCDHRGVVLTTILRPYRIPVTPTGPVITNRNPPTPTAAQYERLLAGAEKAARRYNKQVLEQFPLIGAIGEALLDSLKEQRKEWRRNPRR